MVRSHQVDAAVWCGDQLIKAKEALGHGNYVRWLRDELNMKPRTAQSLMNVAEVFGSKAQAIAHLPQTVLYTLAAPSTPEPVRVEMLDRVRNGEKLSTRQVDEIVKQEKADLVEKERLAKLTEEQREEERKAERRAVLKERRSEAARSKRDEDWRRKQEQQSNKSKPLPTGSSRYYGRTSPVPRSATSAACSAIIRSVSAGGTNKELHARHRGVCRQTGNGCGFPPATLYKLAGAPAEVKAQHLSPHSAQRH